MYGVDGSVVDVVGDAASAYVVVRVAYGVVAVVVVLGVVVVGGGGVVVWWWC